jgi:hypothetical protein
MSHPAVALVGESPIRRGGHVAARAHLHFSLIVCLSMYVGASRCAAQPPAAALNGFTEMHCSSCHNAAVKEGGLDLTALTFEPGNSENFRTWVTVHDRLQSGEMPPDQESELDRVEVDAYTGKLADLLREAEKQDLSREGRATQRRLNRYEFENALRDLLQTPWLQVKKDLPEDGEAELFNKVGDALDVSHVQMTRYMKAANDAMRHVMGVELLRQELPPPQTVRYYAREEPVLTKTFHDGNGRFVRQSPERSTFPVLGFKGQPDVRSRAAPVTVGDSDPELRELEAVGWNRGNYHPFHTIWDRFRAPVAGSYRVRWCGYTIWTGPHGVSAGDLGKEQDGKKRRRRGRWNSPDGDTISRGRRNESITVYAQGPVDVRRVGQFDLTPEPAVYDLGSSRSWRTSRWSQTPPGFSVIVPVRLVILSHSGTANRLSPSVGWKSKVRITSHRPRTAT